MSIKAIIFRFWEHVAVALLAIVVFCFWLFGYPFIPVAREMSVLFLWNCDYLTERLVLPGGMAQYLGECIAQFFLNPVNGALAYAILFVLAQKLSSKLLRQFFPNIKDKRQFYPTDYDKERYSLCRVAFNAHTGRLGEQVDTLINTTVTGKSVTWPRPSYDGRYIMYTQTDFGYFSVWHPEADLWLLDMKTGETRPMDTVNSPQTESLHNWSTGSRWFLFTSRRDDGLYTRIYFSCLDENGKATKPFLLPQHNPKQYYRRLLYSYNTPDFATRPLDLDSRDMSRRIESEERVSTK